MVCNRRRSFGFGDRGAYMVLRFFILASIILLISCTSFERNNPNDPDGINYNRGGQAVSCDMNYGTKRIGDQVWMTENLNCNVSGSKCYDNKESNCATYGRLYNWATAMALPSSCNSSTCASQIGTPHRGICPSGWHIPSDAEWTTLTNFVGGASTAGKYLKATSGWYNNGNGEDKYGFSALPGGIGGIGGAGVGFSGVGYYGHWWSSSEGDGTDASNRSMYYDYDYVDFLNGKYLLQSVRCLQD